MADEREKFYHDVVEELIKDKNGSILICGGGSLDKNTFSDLRFKDVTISNLDTRMKGNEYDPFKWKFENVESLSFDSESFDYVVIHAAIHHASSPHTALTEMYRVARKGILAFEARDSMTMRFLERSGFTQVYEHAAVYFNDCVYGGVNNTEIPNYIYRWTERDVEKTIQSYAPNFKHRFHYRYGTAFPCTPELEKGGWKKLAILWFARPLFWCFAKVFPKQQNQFAFFIEKPRIPGSLFPWLVFDEQEHRIRFNKTWGDQRYRRTTGQ